FPMTFAETLPLVPAPIGGTGLTPGNVGRQVGPAFVPYLNIAPNPTFVQALRGVLTVQPTPNQAESGALLLLSLTQGRRGHVLSADNLGAGALGSGTFVPPIPPPANSSPVLQEIIDAWSSPLFFYRWPVGNPEVVNSNPAARDQLSATTGL